MNWKARLCADGRRVIVSPDKAFAGTPLQTSINSVFGLAAHFGVKVNSTFSLKLTVTLLFNVIPVAPFVGTVELTEGAVLSIVIVLPVAGVSTLLEESVALLWIV